MSSYNASFLALPERNSYRRMREARCGHPTLGQLPPSLLMPLRKAVYHVLQAKLKAHDFHTHLMLKELTALLNDCPRIRQNSLRGQSPRVRAQVILGTIHRQRLAKPIRWSRKTMKRPRRMRAPFIILVRALAVECFDQWPEGSTAKYKRTQVAHTIHRLLWPDYFTLYGQRKFARVSMQGQGVARHLYAMVEPIYRWWLHEHKETILNTRSIRSHP